MSAAADLGTYLLADTGVKTLIGTRCAPDKLEQSWALPAVVYYTISRTHVGTLQGVAAAGMMRVQIDTYASTRLTADAVGAAIVAALKTLAAAGPTTIGAGTKVCDVEIQGPRDDRQAPDDGSDEWTYISSVDAILNLG